MRAAVFNRYWATGGGGERYAGAIGQVLSERFQTELVGFDPIDVSWLSERLALDLTRVEARVIEESPRAVTRLSGETDLFVNLSYMSADPAASPSSLYIVMFPTPLEPRLGPGARITRRVLRSAMAAADARLSWGEGFHARGSQGRRAPSWTDGNGTFYVETGVGSPLTVRLTFGHHRPLSELPVEVSVEADGEVVATTELPRVTSRLARQRLTSVEFQVESREPGVPVEVCIKSGTFVPADVLGTADSRRLGVPLLSIQTGTGPQRLLGRIFPRLLAPSPGLGWIESYGEVVSISEYTREWVQRWWGLDTEVLHPPVTQHKPGTKEPIILNVGRFFASNRGHSKKQLELVRAFRSLLDSGTHGWQLHLAGGCHPDDEPYLDRVRKEAEGYPVHFHIDRPGAELEALYGSASIYWHAAGLGEDLERNPDRAEHFGITTVEAMSAGAVPVVVGRAGQVETVRHGIDGFHFQTIDGLVNLTRMLIDDSRLREQMAISSRSRAARFSYEEFAARLNVMVDRVLEPDAGGEEHSVIDL